MYTIERYMAGIKALTNSIVIKINEVPMVINAGVENTIGYNPAIHKPTKENIREWKYYLNLAGKMHPLDTPIKIRVLETERDEVLTAELLDRYPTTRIELQKMEKFYTNYMDEYPEYVRYIHGCMFPIDIDKAIAAKEGTILSYNPDLIEPNEYYLIPELEKYIKSLLSRWHVKPYTIVDNLYLPGLIAFLYSAIYLKIINLRLEKIGTYQVHSFHLEHFFRSRMDLWDDVNILNKKSLFWLYKNLDVMMHNVGKDLTFKKVYDKLFDMNYVGIGEHILTRLDPKFSDGKNNLNEPSYTRDPASLVTKNLNRFYLTNNGSSESVESMTNKQLTVLDGINKNMPPVFQKYIKSIVIDDTNKNILAKQKTKVLDIDRSELLKKTGLDLFSLVMDYWSYALHKDKLYRLKIQYNGNISTNKKKTHFDSSELEYIDPENKIYNVTPKVGLLMFIKLMLYASGNLDTKISSITYNRVCDFDKVKFQKLVDTIIIQDGISKPVLEAIKDSLPNEPEIFNSIDSFKKFLGDSIELSKIVWVMASNVQNFLTSDAIKRVFLSIIKRDSYPLSEDGKEYTIDELLRQHGINYTINQYTDIVATMKSMIKTFTGVELDQEDVLLQNMEKYRKIIKKLTSYSLHAMGAAGIVDDIAVYYNNPTILSTRNGFVITYGTELKGLEDDIARLKAYAWDNPYYLNINIIELRAKMAMAKLKPLQGDLVLKFQELRKEGWTNGYSADFVTIPEFRLDDYKWYNDWVTVKQAELNALEDKISELEAGAIDSTVPPHINTINLQTAFLNYEKHYGELIVKNGPWVNEIGSYDFRTLPAYWDATLDTRSVLKVAGIDLVPVEDVIGTLDAESKEEPTPIRAKTVFRHKLKVQDEPEGYGVEKHILQTEASFDFSKNYTTLDISNYVYGTKYVKIGLMAFSSTKPGMENSNRLFTYMVEDVVSHKPDIIKRDNREGKYVDDPNILKDIKENSISKTDAIGLAMLPFQVVSDGNTYKDCKLVYIGLLDKDGNMDVYDCSNVKVLTYDDLTKCPVIKTVPNAYHGETVVLPSKASKDKVISVNVNLVENLELPTTTPQIEKGKLLSGMFDTINGFEIGKDLNKTKIDSLLASFIPGVDVNRTIYKKYSLTEEFKIYMYTREKLLPKDLPYYHRDTLRDRLESILAYDPALGYTAQYKWIMINSFYYKLEDVAIFTKEEYQRLGNNSEGIYVRSNKPMLYIDIVDITDPKWSNKLVIVEVDRGYKPRCVNFKTFTRNYTFEEFKEATKDNPIIGNIPRYEIHPAINNMKLEDGLSITKFKDKVLPHVGYYEIGKLEFINVSNNLATGISTTPTKEELVKKFGKEYPWLKDLNIEE
jgi:PHIKZ128